MKKQLLIPLLLLLCSSCMTYEKCAERYGAVRPVEYSAPLEYRLPVEYAIPADSLLLSFSAAESSKDTTSESGIAISYRLDTTNNRVSIGVSLPERVIRDTIVFRDTIAVQVGCMELVKPARWHEKMYSRYKDFSAVALLLIIATLLFIYKICR